MIEALLLVETADRDQGAAVRPARRWLRQVDRIGDHAATGTDRGRQRRQHAAARRHQPVGHAVQAKAQPAPDGVHDLAQGIVALRYDHADVEPARREDRDDVDLGEEGDHDVRLDRTDLAAQHEDAVHALTQRAQPSPARDAVQIAQRDARIERIVGPGAGRRERQQGYRAATCRPIVGQRDHDALGAAGAEGRDHQCNLHGARSARLPRGREGILPARGDAGGEHRARKVTVSLPFAVACTPGELR